MLVNNLSELYLIFMYVPFILYIAFISTMLKKYKLFLSYHHHHHYYHHLHHAFKYLDLVVYSAPAPPIKIQKPVYGRPVLHSCRRLIFHNSLQ